MEHKPDQMLSEIGRMLKEFDVAFGSSTKAVLSVERDGTTSQVTLDGAQGYVPLWGKKIHLIFQPPPPGQTRLVRRGKRLVYEKK